MRIILFLLALPLLAQISVVMEPLGPDDTERVMGSNKNTLWRVYPTTTDLAATSIPRSAVTSITPISELPSKMAKDVLGKHSGVNGLSLLGRGWDAAAPLAGDGLGFAGWALDSKEALYVAGGIKAATLIRKLFVGQAPTPADYADDFLPETIPCSRGNCGEWYVLTERVESPKRVEISQSISRPLSEGLFRQLVPKTEPRPSATSNGPISTHPQVLDEQDQYLVTLERMTRENTARIGASQ